MAKGTLNKVMLIGRLGGDPELKYTPQGQAVCTLTLATNEGYKDQSGNWVERTEWHRIVLWRFLAENAGKYLKKGSQIYVEGKLQTRSWDDQNGQKHYTTEIVASDMNFLSGKNEGEQNQGGYQAQGGYGQPNPQATKPAAQPNQQKQQQPPQGNQPSFDIPDTDFDDDDLPF